MLSHEVLVLCLRSHKAELGLKFWTFAFRASVSIPTPQIRRASDGKIPWVFPALPCMTLGKLLHMEDGWSGGWGTQRFFADLDSAVLWRDLFRPCLPCSSCSRRCFPGPCLPSAREVTWGQEPGLGRLLLQPPTRPGKAPPDCRAPNNMLLFCC